MWAFIKRHAWWIIPLLIFDFFLFRWLWNRPVDSSPVGAGERTALHPVAARPLPRPLGRLYGYPTDQQDLWDTESLEVYQPTASGRIESALYGSVRTRSSGGRLLPAFHMGIDIASLNRDRRNRPLDAIYAVTEGHVAYINAIAGNSNYGIYVVLVHDDPLGQIYTLYAHLARVQSGLSVGDAVARGEEIGVMGNTPTRIIPMARAHLHFEIGVINNQRFARWYRQTDRTPDHGNWHGHNLTGVDPLAVFGAGGNPVRFSLWDYLENLEPAYTLIIAANRQIDYFQRYPRLWRGEDYDGTAMVMTVSEGGVPLSGRTATAAEREQLGRETVVVQSVNEEVLGRNGLRHVVRRQGEWTWGRNGEYWWEIFSF